MLVAFARGYCLKPAGQSPGLGSMTYLANVSAAAVPSGSSLTKVQRNWELKLEKRRRANEYVPEHQWSLKECAGAGNFFPEVQCA